MTQDVDELQAVGTLVSEPPPPVLDDRDPHKSRQTWPLLLLADLAALAGPALIVDHGRMAIAGLSLLTVLFLYQAGMYRSRLHLSVLDEIPVLVSRTACAALIIGMSIQVLNLQTPVKAFLWNGVVAALLLVTSRWLSYRVVGASRILGRTSHRTLIIGGGLVAAQIATSLRDNPKYGLRPVGFMDVDPLIDPASGLIPCLGHPAELPRVLMDSRIRTVVVAFGNAPESSMVDALREASNRAVETYIVPRLYEAFRHGSDYDHIGAVPVIRVRPSRRNGVSWMFKRLFDILVSGIAICAISPVMAMVAIAVRLEGGPGVLFRQERIGRHAKPFPLLKFRSMRPLDDEESATRWNVADDDRIGPVGRFIRRTSLDELPQLLNIMRGDMSLVGPRPERPYFVDEYTSIHPKYYHRHRVPCGLTGLAQVSGLRGDTSISDRARFDNYYIENWSLWLDIKILTMTLREVLQARGR